MNLVLSLGVRKLKQLLVQTLRMHLFGVVDLEKLDPDLPSEFVWHTLEDERVSDFFSLPDIQRLSLLQNIVPLTACNEGLLS